jgi:hypothetical protein
LSLSIGVNIWLIAPIIVFSPEPPSACGLMYIYKDWVQTG